MVSEINPGLAFVDVQGPRKVHFLPLILDVFPP